MNKELVEIMCSEGEIINKIKESGFDIINNYKFLKNRTEKYSNGLIRVIGFEIKDNPLDVDWEDNGTIFLLFEYDKDTISCQIQLESMTDTIDYSDYLTYIKYNNLEFNPPKFKNETDGFGKYDCDTRCDFNCCLDINNFKSNKIFNKITKYIIELDKKLNECIKTQEEINEFEDKYYGWSLNIESENKYSKFYNELTDEEQEELQWELDGIETYNMMVAEGWIDED